MARIVVEVGDTIKDKLRELIEHGYYKTESEIVRDALRKFLMQENKRNGNGSFIDSDCDAEVFEGEAV
jgi:Arc/MetJ-type ribon-helix-helix transcriptional regulator